MPYQHPSEKKASSKSRPCFTYGQSMNRSTHCSDGESVVRMQVPMQCPTAPTPTLNTPSKIERHEAIYKEHILPPYHMNETVEKRAQAPTLMQLRCTTFLPRNRKHIWERRQRIESPNHLIAVQHCVAHGRRPEDRKRERERERERVRMQQIELLEREIIVSQVERRRRRVDREDTYGYNM